MAIVQRNVQIKASPQETMALLRVKQLFLSWSFRRPAAKINALFG